MSYTSYKYLDKHLDDLRRQGRYTFSSNEIISDFNITENAFKKATQHLLQNNRIARLRKKFYLILPPEFAKQQKLPLEYFIDDLMQFLNRKYYVGLLSAAMYHGAAHQQPQSHYIVAEPPYLRPIKDNRYHIIFCMKKGWSTQDIQQHKTDAGFINVSNRSLTSLDIIYYVDRIGGINRAAEILTELISDITPNDLLSTSRRFSQTTILQRLGYLLEHVLNRLDLAEAVSHSLEDRNTYQTRLSTNMDKTNFQVKNRWNVIPNVAIDINQ